jgi:glycosyltransferase involved in cell wall biosynthesis
MDSVCYVLPSLYPSGGNKMCVEHVKRLAGRGHLAAVAIVSKHKEDSPEWLEIEGVKIEPFTKEALNKYSNVVATYWETYYNIKKLGLTKPRFKYFVQSKEEDFENDWFRKNMAIQTLMDPTFEKFTEARWIQAYLLEVCRQPSILVPNCIELPKGLNIIKDKRKKPILLIEGEATSAWKNIAFGSKVSQMLRSEFECWLLTSTPYSKISPQIFGSFDKIIQGVSWREALETIAQADILYRPSLLEGQNGAGLEGFFLGTALVMNKIPGSYEYCINNWNSILVTSNDVWETTEAIRRLKIDIEFKEKLIKNAKETTKQYFDWNKSIDILENVVFCLA